ncbi:hypothetical protein ACXC9Q_26165 (plasmid) [Kribbella sp. CWNU-51]
MSPPSGYLLLGNRDFDLDYRRIDAAASRNPDGPEAILRQRIVREMVDLASGNSNGHHPLGFEPVGGGAAAESFAGEWGAAAWAGGGDRVAGAGELGWRACSW